MRYFKQSTCCYQLCSICCSVFKAGWNCAVTIDFNNLSFLEKRFVLFLDTSLPFVAAKTIRFLYMCMKRKQMCFQFGNWGEQAWKIPWEGVFLKLLYSVFPQIMCSSRWKFSASFPLSPLLGDVWSDFYLSVCGGGTFYFYFFFLKKAYKTSFLSASLGFLGEAVNRNSLSFFKTSYWP